MKKVLYLLVLVIAMIIAYKSGVNHAVTNLEIGNVYDEGFEAIVDEQIYWYNF